MAHPMASMADIEIAIPVWRKTGVVISESRVFDGALLAYNTEYSLYVTWEQVAYMADHGVRMSVMGFGKENLTRCWERDYGK